MPGSSSVQETIFLRISIFHDSSMKDKGNLSHLLTEMSVHRTSPSLKVEKYGSSIFFIETSMISIQCYIYYNIYN